MLKGSPSLDSGICSPYSHKSIQRILYWLCSNSHSEFLVKNLGKVSFSDPIPCLTPSLARQLQSHIWWFGFALKQHQDYTKRRILFQRNCKRILGRAGEGTNPHSRQESHESKPKNNCSISQLPPDLTFKAHIHFLQDLQELLKNIPGCRWVVRHQIQAMHTKNFNPTIP